MISYSEQNEIWILGQHMTTYLSDQLRSAMSMARKELNYIIIKLKNSADNN